MSIKKEKSIRVKLTGNDVDQFEKLKASIEKAVGARMTDAAIVRSIIQYRLDDQ